LQLATEILLLVITDRFWMAYVLLRQWAWQGSLVLRPDLVQ